MSYNILIGGSAGQGVDTVAAIFEKILNKTGFNIFTIRDYMSRVRGGHNFIQVRFGKDEILSHWDELDVIVALNEETATIHKDRLKESGVILCDVDVREDSVFPGNSKNTKNIIFKNLSLKSKAKEIGNIKVSGTVALGALLKILSIDCKEIDGIIHGFFHDEIAAQNIAALETGRTLTDSILNISSPNPGNTPSNQNILINGNQSIALGAIAAGCKFYSAYPMTPSTTIMGYLASKMHEAQIVVEQAEDEIAAINMAIGASYAGVRSMTGTSGGGFSLMVEALGLSSMLEVPVVIAEIQRPGPTTGFPTRTEQADLKFVISASQGEFPRMVISLRSPEDAFYQTVRAFNIADKYQIPVILLGDQYLADYTTTVKPFDLNKVDIHRYFADETSIDINNYKRYQITETGISPKIIPGKIPGATVLVDSDEHDEYGRITESAEVRIQMNNKRLRKLKYLEQELIEPELLGEEESPILIVAWGSTYGPVYEAVELINKTSKTKVSALVFGDIWPLPQKLLMQKALKAESIINIEQNATGQLASLIRECTGISCNKSILKYDGRPMSSKYIFEELIKII